MQNQRHTPKHNTVIELSPFLTVLLVAIPLLAVAVAAILALMTGAL